MPTDPTPEQTVAYTNACVEFVGTLCDPNISDRDAIWKGVIAALATYTYTNEYVLMKTMVERLRKWNEAVNK